MSQILFGVPNQQPSLLHRCRFACGDPVGFITLPGAERVMVVRDIELPRALAAGAAERCLCPTDVLPRDQLSGDRLVATAQAVVQLLVNEGVQEISGDRQLPLVLVSLLSARGIQVKLDPDLGVLDRREKRPDELEKLETAQRVTLEAMRHGCGLIVNAEAGAQGVLHQGGEVLTAEHVRGEIAVFLARRGFSDSGGAIVAQGEQAVDCHERGSGPLLTGLPVIVDIFPCDQGSGYCGDATRTVVHGQIPETVAAMHGAVQKAKAASEALLRPGQEAEAVHKAAVAALEAAGFGFGDPMAPGASPCMPHGTGHGIGLEVHEPILLDLAGGTLRENEVLTVEPALYGRPWGGVRIEDSVVCTPQGGRILGELGDSLDGAWAL